MDEPDDELVILLEPGQEPPGRLVDGFWQGEKEWVTKHGLATCHWLLGTPKVVENALLSDGSRETVKAVGAFRRRYGDTGYISGRVEFTDDDVIFVDLETKGPMFFTNSGPPNLEFDLHASKKMRSLVKSDEFAHALNLCLQHREFKHLDSGENWSCSERDAGDIVAELRRLGESYRDFYLISDEFPIDKTLGKVVVDSVRKLGWVAL
jgi:hypothetical protein